MTKILLVDDHVFVREMLRSLVRREASFEVVGVAGTGDEAIEVASLADPDIVIMDIDMPGLICFDAARRIQSRLPDVRILFLSAHVHDHYVEEALRIGAKGYVTKSSSPDDVLDAVRRLAAGGTAFSPEVERRLAPAGTPGAAAGPGSRLSSLTPREVEVLQYVARGYGKKEIAVILQVSMKTIEKHSQNLMGKLDIHDRVELARFAIREGLVGT